MRRLSFPAFSAALVSAAALLAGCCANNTCDCQDLLEDAIQFRFKIGDPAQDPTSFRPEDVDTVRLVRFRLPVKDPKSTVAPVAGIPDTIVLVRPDSVRQASTTINIANTAPFAISGSQRVNAYRYAVLLGGGRRRAPKVVQRFDFTAISVKGGFAADGCCTCYQNDSKSAYLKTSAPGVNAPARDSTFIDLSPRQIVELSRPR